MATHPTANDQISKATAVKDNPLLPLLNVFISLINGFLKMFDYLRAD